MKKMIICTLIFLLVFTQNVALAADSYFDLFMLDTQYEHSYATKSKVSEKAKGAILVQKWSTKPKYNMRTCFVETDRNNPFSDSQPRSTDLMWYIVSGGAIYPTFKSKYRTTSREYTHHIVMRRNSNEAGGVTRAEGKFNVDYKN